nr:uncharacterized protein LOC113804310 isoform X1 [Penaeus vannamei]
MENLLSASLAQEQEISRELHRRVRDLQILEKDYRGRLDKLETVTRRTEEKASALAQAETPSRSSCPSRRGPRGRRVLAAAGTGAVRCPRPVQRQHAKSVSRNLPHETLPGRAHIQEGTRPSRSR